MPPGSPRIWYLVPDHDAPSWGVGLLCHHVRLLREAGLSAFVLHNRSPFRLSWLDVDVPGRYLSDATLRFEPTDVLVVPEVLAHPARAVPHPLRRVVFVQGSFLILQGADRAFDYRELGYEAALAVLPHVREIVAAHYGLTPAVIPPFVAEYFFSDPADRERPRRRQVLLVGKPEYLQAGYLDQDIAVKLLTRHFERLSRRPGHPRWELVVLSGKTHRETAEIMRRAAFLLNFNTLEAFNTTVPEAMAAGCIPVCYEAYGGRDFLRAGENAFVFPNNHAYPLLERVFDLTENYEERQAELAALRRAAAATANGYREERTARALVDFFRTFCA